MTVKGDDILKSAIFQEYRVLFVILLSLSGAAMLAEVYASIAFRNWVNYISDSEPSLQMLAYGFIVPLMYSISWSLNAMFFKLDINARFLVYKYTFAKLVSKRIDGYIDLLIQSKPGHIMQDIRNASEAVANMYNMLAFYGFSFVVVIISSVILLGGIAWWSPFIVIAISIIFLYASYTQHAVCIQRSREYVSDQGITSGNLVEIFERLRIIKTFRQEYRILEQVEGDVAQEGNSQRRLRSSFLQLTIIQILYKITTVFIFMFIGIFSFAQNRIDIGSLAMLITFSMTFSNTIEALSTRLYELVSSFTKYRQVLENIRQEKDLFLGNYNYISHAEPKESLIQVSDLKVEAGSKTILENVSLTLQARKRVALMGPSGCGKTSLAECILGLRPYQGSIQIFSVKGEEIPPKIVEVEQNPKHIGNTVNQWLTFGAPQAPTNLVRDAIRIARLEDIIDSDNGIELKPGLTLNGLSGGQKQRIAIARAIITQPDYIIMDEPTSALDLKTSEMIMDSITQLGIGLLIITHNHQHIDLFDEIHEFDDRTFKLKTAQMSTYQG